MENKQFKEWWHDKRKNEYINMSISWNQFIELPESMRWGVYLEFFDSVDYHIDVGTMVTHDYFTHTIGDSFLAYINHDGIDGNPFSSRQEAQQEAIKKAFELLSE